jgi:hypothetical protein
MTKRGTRERLYDDDEPTPQRRRRITTTVEPPSTEATFEPRRQTAHALPEYPTSNLKTENGFVVRGPGRPPGHGNLVPRKITSSFMEAIERLGSDGKGTDGVVGYFMTACAQQPAAALAFASRLVPRRIQTSTDPDSALGQILEAARARLQVEKARMIDHSVIDGTRLNGKWKDGR